MKKSIFSKSLYKDGVSQLKVFGIIFFLIMLLFAVLVPLNQVIRFYGSDSTMNKQIVDIFNINPLLPFTFMCFTPVMALNLFSFLNKRNASDFYHAIPQTRMCLFSSFYAAVVTWFTVIIFVTSLISLAFMSAFPAIFVVDWSTSLLMLVNFWISNLLVLSAISVAMCITGTAFTNVIISGLIIFLPRFLIILSISWVSSVLPVIDTSRFIPVLDSRFNIITNFVFGIFTGTWRMGLVSVTSGIYTLLLALIYGGAAMWLFRKRKSEMAGYAAPNRIFQAVYRLLIATVVSLIPCQLIFEWIINGRSSVGTSLFVLFICYLSVVIVYFLYELITTKKVKNLVRAIPGLGILAVVNVVIVGGLCMMYYSALAFSPDAADISSVKIMGRIEENTGKTDYFGSKTEQITLENEKINQIVAKQLADTLDTWGNARTSFYEKTDEMQNMTVAIKTKGRTYYRRIYFTRDDIESMGYELQKEEQYVKAYQELPELEKDTLTVHNYGDSLETEDIDLIYDSLRTEVANMPFEKWYAAVTSTYGEEDRVLTNLELDVLVNNDSYEVYLPVMVSFPETAKLYFDLVNERNRLVEKAKNINEDASCNLDIFSYVPGGRSGEEVPVNEDDAVESSWSYNYTHVKEIAEFVEKNSGEIDPSKPFLEVRAYIDTSDENGEYVWYELVAYIQGTAEDVPETFKNSIVY